MDYSKPAQEQTRAGSCPRGWPLPGAGDSTRLFHGGQHAGCVALRAALPLTPGLARLPACAWHRPTCAGGSPATHGCAPRTQDRCGKPPRPVAREGARMGAFSLAAVHGPGGLGALQCSWTTRGAGPRTSGQGTRDPYAASPASRGSAGHDEPQARPRHGAAVASRRGPSLPSPTPPHPGSSSGGKSRRSSLSEMVAAQSAHVLRATGAEFPVPRGSQASRVFWHLSGSHPAPGDRFCFPSEVSGVLQGGQVSGFQHRPGDWKGFRGVPCLSRVVTVAG